LGYRLLGVVRTLNPDENRWGVHRRDGSTALWDLYSAVRQIIIILLVAPDPLLQRVRPRHAPASGRVLDEAQAVPDQHPRVKLVVDDPGSTRAVARMLVSPQARPSGPGIPSLFKSMAMTFGFLPDANSRKMRRTISASSGMISLSPRIGSPSESNFLMTR
jgi:hypothetical protein